MRGRFAKAASSRNLSTRSVASSTVEPMTLISSPAGLSEGFDVTVTLRRVGEAEAVPRRRAFDAGDLIDGNFHAQRAGFDFGGVAVDAAQHNRLAETADADFCAGLKTVRRSARWRRLRRRRDRIANPRAFARAAALSSSRASPRASCNLAAGRFFELGAQFAIFHRFDDGGDVFVEALLHLGELFFELLDAALLALDPFGAEFLAFVFERLAFGVHLLLRAVEFVAAAMQIGDQVGGFARFGSEQRASALDQSPDGSPSRCAMAMPLEPPGTPTIRR